MQEKGLTRYFNSRPSARGDGKQPKKYSAEALFQFTPLREGRRAGKSQTACGLHFNSRPSARGDIRVFRLCSLSPISIHAPPRGATFACSDFVACHLFQFTPLREGRRGRHSRRFSGINFNSRPSARGDGDIYYSAWGYDQFQFTPLREGRRRRRSAGRVECYFNSRPSARGDMRSENVLIPRSISIHAPPRGATNQPPRVTRIGIISIHAPPRGATWSFPPSRDYPTFQFTPLREGRRKTKTHFWRASTFQFTPLREGRRGAFRHHGITLHFNSRPSARGD